MIFFSILSLVPSLITMLKILSNFQSVIKVAKNSFLTFMSALQRHISHSKCPFLFEMFVQKVDKKADNSDIKAQ